LFCFINHSCPPRDSLTSYFQTILFFLKKQKIKKYIFMFLNCNLMFRLFGHKLFFRKYFMYFSVFGANRKWWSTEIIFSLNVKASLIFGKRIIVLKIVNRFLDLNSSFLQTRLWKFITAEHWSLLVTWIYRRRFPIAGLR
jgi:hypothetical protein